MRPRRLRPAAVAALLILQGAGVAPVARAATPAPAGTPAPPASDPRALTFPPLAIRFPKPERVMLPNGLLVYLFEDRELPFVDLSFYVHAGSIYDPPEKAGLAETAATLLRVGGDAERTPDEVDEALEFMAAQLHLSAGHDALQGRLSALKGSFPGALRILAGLLRTPRFDAARLETEKARVLEGLRRRWDRPETVAALQFRRLVYGADSPWARLATAATIGRLTRDDLVAFHRLYLHPNNMVIGVAGDFEAAAMKELLRATFGPWPRAKVTPPPVPPVRDSLPVGLHLVERPLPQSSIVMGHLGVNRFHPDKFAIKIMNDILGEGGFLSRLMKEVRSTRGLAYSVGGGVDFDSDRGLFRIDCRTRSDATPEAIALIRDVVRRLRDEGPTGEEVRDAKEAEINSFVFSVDGTVPYMESFLYYDYYGYPAGYLETYRDNLAKVTREEVARVARRHLDPERLVVLVVGDAKGFGAPLASLGLGEPRPVTLEE